MPDRIATWARRLTVMMAFVSPVPAAAECVGNGPAKLVLEVTGVRSAAGEVAFTLYPDDRSRFLKSHGKLARARVTASRGATAACFQLPPGSYAVAVYHDENGDHDFNRTLFGPREGYAFSNDAPAMLGLPSLANTRFALPAGGRVMRMRMRYP